MKYNQLNIVISDNGTVLLADDLDRLTGVQFDTLYPGGLYGALTAFVPRKIINAWQVRLGNTLRAYNGLNLVWEGRITALVPVSSAKEEGVSLTAIGYWGDVMMRHWLRKAWCDTRIGASQWRWLVDTSYWLYADICDFDRLNRLAFYPQATAWTNSGRAGFIYYAPTGQTIKRITFDYDFQEGAQAWELFLTTDYETLWTITASGTGSQDITLTTPRTYVYFVWHSTVTQTPPADKTIYGKITNIKVYTETGSINLTEIAKDVRAIASEISTDEHLIASNTLDLIPFLADPPESLAAVLVKASSYGDASYNAWAVGIRGSHLASDAKPILFVEQQPVLTDFDYAVRADDLNVVSQLAFSQNVEDVRNYIIVQYQTIEGFAAFVTPDDDATLKDTASIALYGERHEFIAVQTTDIAKAKNVARRILAARKDPQWRADNQIQVQGYIRDKYGSQVPACEIQAGKRIKIENWLNDLSGVGLTFLIVSTNYNDTSETCTLGIGQVDQLDVFLSRLTDNFS